MSIKNLLLIISIGLLTSCNSNTDKAGQNDANDNESLAVAGAATGNSTLAATAIAGANDTGTISDTEMEGMYAKNDSAKKEIAKRKSQKSITGFYPEGSQRKLTVYDIQYLSTWGHAVMLNEIYARHGMIFTDEALNKHFKRQKWYKPVSKNIFQSLTPVEKENITFLINHPIETK